MHSRMRIITQGDEITLISQNGGGALAWLLVLEVVALGALTALLASAMPDTELVWLPVLASAGLVAWTFRQIESDFRITLSRATRTARIVRIAPITGVRTTAEFPLEHIESLTLEQAMVRPFARQGWNEYVVAVELRGGVRHPVSLRGPLIAYQESVARFSRATGLGSRVRRLPAA